MAPITAPTKCEENPAKHSITQWSHLHKSIGPLKGRILEKVNMRFIRYRIHEIRTKELPTILIDPLVHFGSEYKSSTREG